MQSLPISKSTGVTYVGGSPSKQRYKIEKKNWRYIQHNQNVIECENALDRLEIDHLSNIAQTATMTRSEKPHRGFQLCFSRLNEIEKSVLKKILNITNEINKKFFEIQIDRVDTPALSRFQKGDYEDWYNTTIISNPSTPTEFQEKLQVLIELSNKEEMIGSDFMVKIACVDSKIVTRKTSIYVYPSWTLKSVTPLLQGQHQYITLTFYGPKFK